MKISKHLHSCLLIEEEGKTVLIDPGSFTYQEKALETNALDRLDYILITHEHSDHMSIAFIKELLVKFPDVQVISNPSIQNILSGEDISVHTDLSTLPADIDIQIEELAHEKLWDIVAPQNVLFNVYGKLTHPGDSHHFDETREVLALPVQAPWGSTKQAVELALRLKPKVIIPIHDWMWKDGVRKAMYERLKGFFKQHGIDFKSIESSEVIEI